MKRFFSFLIAAALLCPTALLAQTSTSTKGKSATAMPSKSVERRVKELHALLNEQWEYTLRTSPEFASILGDKRYNDKLADYSQAAIDRDIEQNRIFLKKFEAVDAIGLPEQEKLNRDLMVSNLRQQLEEIGRASC